MYLNSPFIFQKLVSKGFHRILVFFIMEYPDLGKHCSKETCKRLDFLPVKCDACEQIFCSSHMSYAQHECVSAYKKNIQVPVCPLCNKPVPVERGILPDVAVGNHIDNYCQADRAQERKKVFTNKCSIKGCKIKEIVPVVCEECRQNYCFKHRHVVDHNCGGTRQRTAEAAILRQKRNSIGENIRSLVTSVQGNMSEDEALAKALQMSVEDDRSRKVHNHSHQNCQIS